MVNVTIEQSCRACQIRTEEESQRIFIFDTVNLPEVFKEATSLDIQENDGLPKILCTTCCDRLLDAYNFKKMCSAAVLYFKEILSTKITEKTSESLDRQCNDGNAVEKTDNLLERQGVSGSEALNDVPQKSRHREISNKTRRDKLPIDSRDDTSLKSRNRKKSKKKREKSRVSKKNKKNSHPGDSAKFVCNFCKSSFQKKRDLRIHIRKDHLGLKHILCKICGKDFRSSYKLNTHLYVIHQVAKVSEKLKETNQKVCAICGVESLTADECKNHMKIHKKDNKWSCALCPFKAPGKNIVVGHTKIVHQGLKAYHCPRCEKSFTTAVGLEQHVLRHDGIKNFVCKVCGVKKVTERELRSHMNSHKEKFSCEFCSYKFIQHETLMKHIKAVHEVERPKREFKCSLCTKVLKSKASLEYHLMTHSGERPYACSECPKKFIRPILLKNHMKIHSSVKEIIRKMAQKLSKTD